MTTDRSKDAVSAATRSAQIAKGALRRLAMAKLEPTPANYARAWREEGGEAGLDGVPEPPNASARAATQALAVRLAPAGPIRDRLLTALQQQRWQDVHRLVADELPSPADQAEAWADVIDRSARQLERGSRTWPVGRRRESLRHVLNGSRTDPQRLLQRLQGLVASWDGDVHAQDDDETDPASVAAQAVPATDGLEAAAAADPAALAQQALSVAIDAVAQSVSPVEASSPQAAGPFEGAAGEVVPVPTEEGAAETACIATDAIRGEAEAPWPGVVGVLERTLQAALPSGEARASEVGARLQRAADGLSHTLPGACELDELRDACEDVRRVLQHRHHLVDQLGGLVQALTDGLGELAEDDSWVEGQCMAMREQLDIGLTSRGISAVSDLLGTTRQRQQRVRAERAQARDALKQLIHRMLQDIGELSAHTGRFNDSVGRYAEVIGQADSLEGLAGVVREMVEETRTVHGLVSQTTQRLHEEHEKARVMADRVRELEDELRQLSHEVCTDQLTQVANRRGLMRIFEAEKARFEREAAELSIGLLDIDNFKRLNDTLGHQTGDEALKFLAQRVTVALRPTDSLARYGGEEFVVLLPGTPADEAQRVLTRVQRGLSAELFMYEGKQTFVTFSAGVTLYRAGETIEVALQRADEALYEAKRTGKNRTCVS